MSTGVQGRANLGDGQAGLAARQLLSESVMAAGAAFTDVPTGKNMGKGGKGGKGKGGGKTKQAGAECSHVHVTVCTRYHHCACFSNCAASFLTKTPR